MDVLEDRSSDLAYFSLLTAIVPTTDPAAAFKDVSAAVLIEPLPSDRLTPRKHLLSTRFETFKALGEALEKSAKKSVKVVVVGNLPNTNTLVASLYAPLIPRENFSAVTRIDEIYARAEIADHLHTDISKVKNLIIWGNRSGQ